MPEPNLISGHGGKIIISTTAELAVSEWRRTQQPEVATVTHSGSGGRKARKRIVADDQFSFTCLWDSNLTPEDCSLTQGSLVTATFYIGDSGKRYAGVPLFIEQVTLTGCTQSGVVSYDVTAYVQGAWSGAITST